MNAPRRGRDLRRQMIDLAAAILYQLPDADLQPLLSKILEAGVRTQLGGDLALPSNPALEGLGLLEQGILRMATPRPETAKRLAAKMGRPCNSYFRQALNHLVRLGRLRHTPDGYCLPP